MSSVKPQENTPPADTGGWQYPKGVPNKFTTSGDVCRFPGNTIVSHLHPESKLYQELLKLFRELEAKEHRGLYTLLPPSSWHMTVFEGVCDKIRTPGRWPSDLSNDASLEACNEHFSTKLLPFNLEYNPPYQMQFQGYEPSHNVISLTLKPSSTLEEERLRALRDGLSKVLAIRGQRHETYYFHITLAYFVRFPSDQEKSEIDRILMDHFEDLPKNFELGAPEFCLFDDMCEFRRQFYLKASSN